MALAATVEQYDESVEVTHGDFTWNISYVWLRDHCRCHECYSSSTFQRHIDAFSIPLDIKPECLTCSSEGLVLTWQDGHVTTHIWEWLAECAPGRNPPRADVPRLKRILWDGKTLENLLPEDIPFEAFMETEGGLKEAVERFYKFGVVFIDGAQPTEEDIGRAANRLSRIQDTFYGSICIVTSDGVIADTAYSNLALKGHTDSTYFHDAMGALLFSLFNHDGEGGSTGLVDGFHAAAVVKEKHPVHYGTLSTVPIAAHFTDSDLHLEMRFTHFNHDPITGEFNQLRYNNADRSPLSHLSLDDIGRYYAAHHALAGIIQSAASEYVFRLSPGRIMVMDNWRVLHSRTGFTGSRTLATAYLQHDEIDSKMRTMLGVKV